MISIDIHYLDDLIRNPCHPNLLIQGQWLSIVACKFCSLSYPCQVAKKIVAVIRRETCESVQKYQVVDSCWFMVIPKTTLIAEIEGRFQRKLIQFPLGPGKHHQEGACWKRHTTAICIYILPADDLGPRGPNDIRRTIWKWPKSCSLYNMQFPEHPEDTWKKNARDRNKIASRDWENMCARPPFQDIKTWWLRPSLTF